MSEPGWPPAAPDGPPSRPETASLPLDAASFESDLAELAATFSAHGGGMFPADLSAELALEIVLNEIVEQACLATGATGAAVILERDGEMVCRASSGHTAPELGSRLDAASGLSGECIRTGRTQRCDDAQADPRADAAASQRLGVRSVLVLPLIAGNRVVGLFEVFSPRAWAFGERDERTLEALAVRVIKNLERAAEPLESLISAQQVANSPVVNGPFGDAPVGDGPVGDRPVVDSPLVDSPLVGSPIEAPVARPVEAAYVAGPVLQDPQAGSEAASVPGRSDHEPHTEGVNSGSGRRVDFVGWALSAAVLACTLLLVVLIVQRFGVQRARVQRTGSTRVVANRNAVQPAAAISTVASGATASAATIHNPKGAAMPGGRIGAASAAPASAMTGEGRARSAPPAGSLLVFENGKEVFRMPPSQYQAQPPAATGSAVERAASVAPERVVALSPAAAESSLIHRVEPDYPEAARDQQLQGAVVLDVHIGHDGTVQDVSLVSGEALLADAAKAAVRQWRFQPRLIDGAPAEMQTKVTLNFRLSN
jgi:TonB family protein